MYTLTADEKTSLVMVYTQMELIRAELVTKTAVRVSTWLRTDSAADYLHLLRAQVFTFSGSGPRSIPYDQLFFPVGEVIAFHIAPPGQDPLDYEVEEKNRVMQPVTAMVGSFQFHGNLRVSTQTDISSSLATARIAWMSVYDIEINNPHMPQGGALRVPMAVVRPNRVGFAIRE